jgi:hypothetical protein
MATRKKRGKKRGPGRPKGSKNKRKGSKKTRKKSAKKKAKRRSGKMPEAVIRKHAKTLKKNKRAADIYRDVLGC